MQPTSSQTLAKMRAGSASRATSVATRRSAACSRTSASSRGGVSAVSVIAIAGRSAPRGCGGARRRRARCPSVSKIDVTCFSTALSVITSSSAMPLLERPSAISSSTSRSRGESSSSGSTAAAAAEHLPDDLGVEHRAAVADAADGVRERVEVADAVLEQVADALGAARRSGRRRSAPRCTARAPGPWSRAARRGSPSPRAGRRRCWSAASGCRRPPRRAGARATLRRRSTASPAWPTTSKPASSSSRLSPLRNSSWSSPMTTRIRSSELRPASPSSCAALLPQRADLCVGPAAAWRRSPARRSGGAAIRRARPRPPSVRTTRGARSLEPERGGDGEAVDVREVHVEQHGVGSQAAAGGERGHAVACLADDRSSHPPRATSAPAPWNPRDRRRRGRF